MDLIEESIHRDSRRRYVEPDGKRDPGERHVLLEVALEAEHGGRDREEDGRDREEDVRDEDREVGDPGGPLSLEGRLGIPGEQVVVEVEAEEDRRHHERPEHAARVRSDPSGPHEQEAQEEEERARRVQARVHERQ
jgi:hypothetical protein